MTKKREKEKNKKTKGQKKTPRDITHKTRIEENDENVKQRKKARSTVQPLPSSSQLLHLFDLGALWFYQTRPTSSQGISTSSVTIRFPPPIPIISPNRSRPVSFSSPNDAVVASLANELLEGDEEVVWDDLIEVSAAKYEVAGVAAAMGVEGRGIEAGSVARLVEASGTGFRLTLGVCVGVEGEAGPLGLLGESGPVGIGFLAWAAPARTILALVGVRGVMGLALVATPAPLRLGVLIPSRVLDRERAPPSCCA